MAENTTTEQSDFERGVRAGIEAFDAYFRDENEGLFAGFASLRDDRGPEVDWRHYSDEEFEGIREGAARDALWDERNRLDRESSSSEGSDR